MLIFHPVWRKNAHRSLFPERTIEVIRLIGLIGSHKLCTGTAHIGGCIGAIGPICEPPVQRKQVNSVHAHVHRTDLPIGPHKYGSCHLIGGTAKSWIVCGRWGRGEAKSFDTGWNRSRVRIRTPFSHPWQAVHPDHRAPYSIRAPVRERALILTRASMQQNLLEEQNRTGSS
jgi:hypothetical protein